MMLTCRELLNKIIKKKIDVEVRIGDVAEQDDLHCSVGKVVYRNGVVILVPGGDLVWKDETLASEVLSEQLWPEEEESET